MNFTTILGIETSCDETGAAILSKVEGRIKILSNCLASSSSIQSKYGGVIPEQAAREQVKSIIPILEETLKQAKLEPDDLDAIAVTQGPGLIGSLLVGVETAKTLAWVWNKPLVAVNHLLGHFWANWIEADVKFPCLGLLASGGHTDLVLFKNNQKYTYLGGTRDDAAGECFDKCARLLGLPYPGGPRISKLARKGNPGAFDLPRPMKDSNDLDFSFSGLKTAVSLIVQDRSFAPNNKADLAASIEQAIIDCLINKTIETINLYRIEQVMLAGGVVSNQKLISELKKKIADYNLGVTVSVPSPNLCTDNAAMIASRAFFQKPLESPFSLEANPNLSLI